MAKEDFVELKFRLSDGTDIGPSKYDPSTTVATLKEFIVERWPQDKEIAPKTINDVKLINGGKILENNKTIAESRVPVGELPGGVITMHVVVRPPVFEKNNGSSKLKPKSIADVAAQSSDKKLQILRKQPSGVQIVAQCWLSMKSTSLALVCAISWRIKLDYLCGNVVSIGCGEV